MAQALLLAVLIVFCSTVGYSMSANHANVWMVLVFTVAAIVALQISYVLGLIADALHG